MMTLSNPRLHVERRRGSASRAWKRCALTLAVFAWLPCAGEARAEPQPAASDDGAAKALLRRGYAALGKNDLEAAHNAFSEAWTKKRHFAVALSLAEVEMRLGRYVEAADHWQFVLRNLPDDLAEKRSNAEERLAECKKRVGTLTVQVKPAEAALFINGAPIAEPPAGREIYLNPGNHDLVAEKDGKRSRTRAVHLSAGAKLSLELVVDDGGQKALLPHAATNGGGGPGAVAQGPPLVASGLDSVKVPVVVSGLVLTLGGATVGTAFLLKSNAASDDAESAFERAVAQRAPGVDPHGACAVAGRPSACDEAEGRVADYRKYRAVAVGAFVGTGVVAAATAVAWWLWPRDGHRKVEANAQLTPIVGTGFAAVTVSGKF